MGTEDYEVVDPRADVLIESLRAFGYNLQTAIADLIDNSITAQASLIEVDFFWSGPGSWIRIADNGLGMSEERLREAMRPGTQSPLDSRDPRDLGRFGLGLKTASFSQCRRFTVRSKAERHPEATRCWDLDFVQQVKTWGLLKGAPDKQSEGALSHRAEWQTRTVVLWEKLDRVVGTERADDVDAKRYFLRRVDSVSEHLGMVFHRFLTGPRALKIAVNGRPVAAWDPFLSDHPSTQALPSESYGGEEKSIRVQPHVLPHQSKLTAEEHGSAGGPRGWNAQQGFYIYRNRRLLVPGDWISLYRQEEHYKLARIQVDVPTSEDSAWKIDVRKAQASPPDDVREFLRRVAEATRGRAVEVYRHRGRVLARGQSRPPIYMWHQIKRQGRIYHRINRDHPLVKTVLEDPTVQRVKAVLSLIEETTPVNMIIGSFTENTEQQPVPYEGAPAELERVMRAVAAALRARGLSVKEIRTSLLSMDPFQHYPELVQAIDFDTEEGKGDSPR